LDEQVMQKYQEGQLFAADFGETGNELSLFGSPNRRFPQGIVLAMQIRAPVGAANLRAAFAAAASRTDGVAAVRGTGSFAFDFRARPAKQGSFPPDRDGP
jgi:hypothetical protein